MVPPPDELQQEKVPAAPKVVNMTYGAVSQADAQHWADANNWSSGWYRWAEANTQPALLRRLAGAAVVNPVEEQALAQGARINDPDCSLFPISLSLFSIGADGKAYFARKRLPTDTSYVFVAAFAGPCVTTATYPDGHTQSIPQTSAPTIGFIPGDLRHDELLGDIWYTDAGGSCSDTEGPPSEWCGR